MSPALFDTHTHLCDPQFDADRDAVLERAAEAGVARIVEIADAPSEWEKALALARARPGRVRCSLGLHPYYADQYSEELAARLTRLARLAEVVAVGEIGLDFVKTDIAPGVQALALEGLLDVCRRAEKPAVIHCRGAYESLRGILASLYPAPPKDRRFWGVVHCFSGSAEDAVFCVERGFALGVDGPVTYPKNDALRAALRQAGLEALVLETDSPYLPPQSSRGKRNEPAATLEIAQKLALVFERSLDEIAAATSANASALYGLEDGKE
jgi:TatD DNase family protein